MACTLHSSNFPDSLIHQVINEEYVCLNITHCKPIILLYLCKYVKKYDFRWEGYGGCRHRKGLHQSAVTLISIFELAEEGGESLAGTG